MSSPPSPQVTSAEAAETLLRRRYARRNLLAFEEFVHPWYRPGRHHRLVASLIHEMIWGDLRRLIIRMPPRHGKSQQVSRDLPAFLFGQNPNEKIIAASYGADLARDMNADVQEIMDSAAYRTLFPKSTLPDRNVRTLAGREKRNSDTFGIVGASGTYLGTGVGGPITGKGASWLIIDDPVKNREEADSETIREKIWRWYSSTARTRLAPDARVILCMTPWHADDIGFRLIAKANENPKATQWRVVDLPAIAEGPANEYDWRNPGEPLWPEQWPLASLEAARADIDDYDWFPLYQLRPMGAGSSEWPADYFGDHIWFKDWPTAAPQAHVLALDPSKGTGDKPGDFQALVDMRLGHDGLIYVDADLRRMPGDQLAQWVFDAQTAVQAHAVGVEVNGFQELIAREIARLGREPGAMPVPIRTIANHTPKDIRIRRLGPFLRSRSFRIRDSKSGRLLVDQLKAFPKGTYDDGPDAMEMGLRLIQSLRQGKQPKQQATQGVRPR